MVQKRLMVVVGLLCILLILWGCAQQLQKVNDEPRQLSLIYAGNLDGELEPCGCSLEGNLGGVLRQAETIDRWRELDPNLFLLSSGGLIVSHTPHDKNTGEFILKGYAQMGFDAIGVQWPDRAYGDGFISGYELPWVSANAGELFTTQKEVARGDVTLTVFSWLDVAAMRNAESMLAMPDQGEAMTQLLDGLSNAKSKQRTTVVMTTLPLEAAKQLLPMKDIDILLIESSYEVYGEPVMDNGTLVLQPGSRGMRFARVDAVLDGSGKIVSYQHEVKSMPPAVPDAQRLLGWYQEYTERLKEAYQESVAIKKKLKAEGSPYAGAKACKACHAQQYDTWKQSKHSKAFRALTRVNKAFDAACIQCHVVGFEKPGGFIDPEITSKLENVQCESCHGAAAAHVASSGVTAVENKGWKGETMCAQCHVQKHSPSFKFEDYWPKISH